MTDAGNPNHETDASGAVHRAVEVIDDEFIHLHTRARRPPLEIQDMIPHDEIGALKIRVKHLEDIRKALAESAAAKDIESTRQKADILKLQERVAGLERLIEVGAGRLHYFAEQRDASFALARKALTDGRQIEMARQRMWAMLMDEDVTKERKVAMREILLTGDTQELMKLGHLIERQHQHRHGAACVREDASAHVSHHKDDPHEDCQGARGEEMGHAMAEVEEDGYFIPELHGYWVPEVGCGDFPLA
jgi:hypothetical protein